MWPVTYTNTKIWSSMKTLTSTMSFWTKVLFAMDFTPVVHWLITNELVHGEAFGLWCYGRIARTGDQGKLRGARWGASVANGGWWCCSNRRDRSCSSSWSSRWRSIPQDCNVCAAVKLLLWSITETTQATDSIHTPVVSWMKGEEIDDIN